MSFEATKLKIYDAEKKSGFIMSMSIVFKYFNCVHTGSKVSIYRTIGPFFFFFFLNSVLRSFQDYFRSYETGQTVGGRKQKNPENQAHWQAELGLSHMCPVRGSNPQTQW